MQVNSLVLPNRSSTKTQFLNFKVVLFLILIVCQVSADHGQRDCQANEVFIECGTCEASCKFPLIKNCSNACRPPRCECQSINGFVRAHDGACIHVSECETYRIMSRLHPGQHVAIVDHDLLKQVPPTTTTTVKKHKKKHHIQFDAPPTAPPQAKDYSEEKEVGNNEVTTTIPSTTTKNIVTHSRESNEEKPESGLPPSIAPPSTNHRNSTKKSSSHKKHSQPIDITKNYHILDRDSFLVGAKHFSTSYALTTDSSPGQIVPPTQKPSSLFGNDENEEESGNQGGYGLQAPTQQQTYGARPILRGEISDKYVPRMPSGAPSRSPTSPGTSPYRYAYAPSSPVLMHDDSAYALYPPQKYRIYKRETMPIGPPRRRRRY